MRYEDKRINNIRIAYVGGGSGGWTRTFTTDLAVESSISGTIRLYNIDAKVPVANETIGNRLSQRPETAGKWTYEICISLEETLAEADSVVVSILPGTFDKMAVGVHMPERLRIYQPVGDTTGPRSMVRTLRTIPMYAEFAEAVRGYAPRAQVINYANPMLLHVKTLYHVSPQIKAFGCYHEVFDIQKVLKRLLEDTMGLKGINRKGIRVNALGISHFTWFDYASYKGIGLFPIYRKCVGEHFEEGYAGRDTNWTNACLAYIHRIKFGLFRRYGLITAAGDRHLAESTPGDEYLKDPETVTRWRFGLASMDWRKEDLEKRMERSRELLRGETEIDLKPTGEEGILLIKALCSLERVVNNANIPSTKLQIPNLPAGAVVGTNAIFERDTIRPMPASSVPEPVKALIMPAVENHETILETAPTCNEELMVQAFMNDPQVRGRNCRKENIRKLIRDMVEGTIKYLPKAWVVHK